ncbi:MAG TPA: hypothetical protein VGF55_20080 [Gemmataceae bacterium]|jgi:hypothetical protein
MTHGFRFRRWAVRLAAAGAVTVTLAGRAPAGEWPVPWPPPADNNPPPTDNPPPPPGDTNPPPGTGQPPPDNPPPIDVPPGTGQPPPVDVPPVPPPGGPPPGGNTPEPASAVLGLCGVAAGLIAWRRKRAS